MGLSPSQQFRQDDEAEVEQARQWRSARTTMFKYLEETEHPLTEGLVAPGDWVVYHLGAYASQLVSALEQRPRKFGAEWSFPHKVTNVADKVAWLTPVGAPNKLVKVPVRYIRKLGTTIPETLEPLLTTQVQLPWKPREATRKGKPARKAQSSSKVIKRALKGARLEAREVDEPEMT
eukprot:Protomagalhaensia_wolfi_Nauph_80__3765@NODE_3808_length_705_cov_4_710210_g3005_i0_p1_GENE_NODE_3808_length_705_cov_4_710210_g3005_i0NODE_3808_length_705_cov_4_710210_g3005_i0_p1_ORF_typecomplete_len177_score10_73HupF_HypC/PF01455_18/0_053HupF_HypC/PF01455_18/6_2e02Glyco_hydro_8/PF01270_17/0_13_NODE_3808_length_705_cov_4_710210_g3005_i0106636